MEQVSVFLEPVRVFMGDLGTFLPRLALAAIVLVAGWLVAKLARLAIDKTLRAVNFHVLTDRAGLDGFLRQGGVDTDTTGLIGVLVYWLVVLAALLIGFNGLGLTYITELLRQVVLFVPHVIVALVIIAFGSYFARFIGNAVTTYCRNVGMTDADLLGRLAVYAIMTFVVLIALDQLRIGGDIIRQSFLIILAGVVFALSRAFGLGGKHWAAALLERWFPREKGSE